MPSAWAAAIKLLYPADENTFAVIDDVAAKTTFDVVANVEIGRELNQNVDSYDLWVSIRNLSKSTTVAIVHDAKPLAPATTPYLAELKAHITPANVLPGATLFDNGVEEGDILQAVATFKVTAGINDAYSTAQSFTFVVSAP